MEGPEDPLPAAVAMSEEGGMVDRRGMISRAVEQVFSSAIELKETGWEVRGECVFECVCICVHVCIYVCTVTCLKSKVK